MSEHQHKDHPWWKRSLFFIKFLEIRLRFVLILVVTALVVGYWDHIQNHYERWQRQRHAGHQHEQAAEQSDYEYVCGMHPFVVRPRPDKCPICGMDLTRRKKGEATQLPEGTLARVQVSPERIMQAGVQVEPVGYRLLVKTVRSYGLIEPDETRQARIVARFPGRIDQLMVNSTGQIVKKGEPLARIYSPRFLAAAQEYVQAVKARRRSEADPRASADEKRRAAQLADYARQRLTLAGFTSEQLDRIEAQGEVNENVTLYAPLAGTVLEKSVLQGDTVEEGTALYSIADLSRVWVQVLVLESDLAAVRQGMPVQVTTVSWPGEIFYGVVDFIYPTLSPENRSVKVRVAVDNAKGRLKPGMYVTATLRSPLGRHGDYDKMKPVSLEPEGKTGAAVPLANEAKAKTGKNAKAPARPTATKAEAEAFRAGLKPGQEYYWCWMHADEVVSDKPGQCDKCGGMKLEKIKRGEEQAVLKSKGVESEEEEAGAGEAEAGHHDHAQAGDHAHDHAPAAVAGAPGAAKLPTQTQEDADQFLSGLSEGATYYTCPMHPEVVTDKATDNCPKCGMKLEAKTKATGEAAAPAYAKRWEVGYSCEMHPDELSETPGQCVTCDCGMEMKKIMIEKVLAVPEHAVIDTGTRMVVYVESMPGVYDARAVQLGPRAGEFYPVLGGLEMGTKIVARGSFLIDAEARLNPVATASAPAAEGAAENPASSGTAGHQHGS